MNRQWIGKVAGTNNGSLCLNIEQRGSENSGTLTFQDTDPSSPSLIADLTVSDSDTSLSFTATNIRCLSPSSLIEVKETKRYLQDYYPESVLPEVIYGEGTLTAPHLISGSWYSDSGTDGQFELMGLSGPYQETPVELLQSWNNFKEIIASADPRSVIFRGQSDASWGLRTKFHRSSRSDLIRYFSEDIPRLYRHIHASTGLKFDLSKNDELGSLLYLAQHHGYPTPLLDWSYSPYVAAYFAFSGISDLSDENSVRIYMLDHQRWAKETFQTNSLLSHGYTVSYMELLASGNKRSLPQQAVTTFSTIDWIEAWINHHAKINNHPYLKAFDIPSSEKPLVMNDLQHMGITPSTLFPGLDGICQELRERDFSS